MPTINIPAERTDFSVKPGSIIRFENPLNQGDVIDVTLNAAALLGAETLSSAAWSADSGISVSNEAVVTPNATATLTAGSSSIGTVHVEAQLTGSGNTIRSVLIELEIVNLR